MVWFVALFFFIFFVFLWFFLNCWMLKTAHRKQMTWKLKSQKKIAKKQSLGWGMLFHPYWKHWKDEFLVLLLKKYLTLMYYLPWIVSCSLCFNFFRVWNVRYNHSHDQLILTGSSDSRVILSNMVSISSEPFGHMVDDDELSDQEDQHQEEKYEVSWVLCRCL